LLRWETILSLWQVETDGQPVTKEKIDDLWSIFNAALLLNVGRLSGPFMSQA